MKRGGCGCGKGRKSVFVDGLLQGRLKVVFVVFVVCCWEFLND